MHQAETAAFLNQKGGVGKTTSVVNVGAGLTILGKKVLIIDLDPQGHLTGFLGIDPEEIDYTIYDVMRGRVHPREAIITRPLRARIFIGGSESQLSMSVLPASLDLAEADTAFANTFEREHLLKRAIARINGDYDYILFDCPPSLGLITVNALAASKKVSTVRPAPSRHGDPGEYSARRVAEVREGYLQLPPEKLRDGGLPQSLARDHGADSGGEHPLFGRERCDQK
jgi:cellulose biosynthesis protein BcsQ